MDLLRDELTPTLAAMSRVSCIPSGAWTLALRSPHGVVTGGATRSAPAATSRSAMSPLSLHPQREPDRAGHPAAGFLIASTDSAWAPSNSSSVARPASSTTTLPVAELQSAICSSPTASR